MGDKVDKDKVDKEVVEKDAIATEKLSGLAEERGRIYSYLSAIYIKVPSMEFAKGVLDEETSSSLSALPQEPAPSDEMKEGLEDIKRFIKKSKDQEVEEVQKNLAVDWTRLFRGLKPEYSPPPPYESVYRDEAGLMMGKPAIVVKKKYAEAGVGLPDDYREPPDYIGIELDFMRFLTEKEAESWKKGEQKDGLKYLEKEYSFLKNHLTKWVPQFCDKVVEMAQFDFYRGMAKMTKGFLAEDREKLEGLILAARQP